MTINETMALHLRVNGQTHDTTFEQVDVAVDANDAQILRAAARHLGLNERDLTGYVVVRETTAIIVRPAAVYG